MKRSAHLPDQDDAQSSNTQLQQRDDPEDQPLTQNNDYPYSEGDVGNYGLLEFLDPNIGDSPNCHEADPDNPGDVNCLYLGEPYSHYLKNPNDPFTSEGRCDLS